MPPTLDTLRECCGSLPLGDETDRTVGDVCAEVDAELARLRREVAHLRADLEAVTRERDEYEARWSDAQYEVEQSEDELDALRADLAAKTAEVGRLRGLVVEMWERAERWSGPATSSHYRSEVGTRVEQVRAALAEDGAE